MEEEYEEEELVGSEEESKNWPGIVISLVVIVFILAMIVTAIAIITDGEDEIEPGKDLPFSFLTDRSLLTEDPIFQYTHDGRSYITVSHNQTHKSMVMVEMNPRSNNATTRVLIPSYTLIKPELKDLRAASLSPDKLYVLLKLQKQGQANCSYMIYRPSTGRFINDSNFQLANNKVDYATWMGERHEIVYLRNNEVLYQPSLDTNPSVVSAQSPAEDVITALPSQLYKDILHRDNMLWTYPKKTLAVYSKISQSDKRSKRSAVSADRSCPSPKDVVMLYVADPANNRAESMLVANTSRSRLAYLSAISWMGPERLITVWINSCQNESTYLICNLNTAQCVENFVYSSGDLNWMGIYQAPVFNSDYTEYYTILPDPLSPRVLHRHLASIKVDKSRRSDPEVTFLTSYQWSDDRIVELRNGRIYYMSSGSNFTHRHLYSYSLANGKDRCLTCNLELGVNCTYVDVVMSSDGETVFLSCLGPDIPSYHILSTEQLHNTTEKVKFHHQINQMKREKIQRAFAGIKTPKSEYYTIPLARGFEASLRLHVPAMFDREKNLILHGLVIIVNTKLGEQRAVQKYPDMLTTYLSKNQSYLVADVDVRGSANRGEKLQQAVYQGLGLIESSDIKQIVKYIKMKPKHFKVNESMIAVIGYGYGGFVALHTMRKNVTSCAIAVTPVTDLRNMNSFELQRYMGNRSLTDTDLKYQCLKGEECRAPDHQNVLLIHGTEDKLINYDNNSLKLMRKLQLADYEFKLQVYPFVGHDIASSSVYKHFYQTIINYLSACFTSGTDHLRMTKR